MDGDARAKVNRRLLRTLGLAGLAGVAATGAVIARSERQRRAVTPDEVRERLHARLAGAPGNPVNPGDDRSGFDDDNAGERQ